MSAAEAPDVWAFQWVERNTPAEHARVTGQLRWGGFDLLFEVDGLEGLDGRLSAPSLATLPPHLQQVVLHHFADACLQARPFGPMTSAALRSVQWHDAAVAMRGPLAFTLRRAAARGISRGRLMALDATQQPRLMDAFAALGWPLPAAWALLPGHLQVGTLSLTPIELAGLGLGDLVWVDDAELSPAGLRAQFHAQDDSATRTAWLKRSALARDAGPHLPNAEAAPSALSLTSPLLNVARSWLHGAPGIQRLPSSALATTWSACRDGQPLFAGRLMVVGRRICLKVTHVQPGIADATTG